MKLSKRAVGAIMKRDVKIILPRLSTSVCKSLQNNSFKRKKTKRGRISSNSNKENEVKHKTNSISQPRLKLIKIESALDIDQRNGCPQQLRLSDDDRRLLQATFSNNHNITNCTNIDSLIVETEETECNGVVLRSKSVNISKLTANREERSYNTRGVKMKTATSSYKFREETIKKKYFAKNSDKYVPPQKSRQSTKRKFSKLSDSTIENGRQTRNAKANTSIFDTPLNEVHGLENVIKSYSSHNCTDRIDQEANNVDITRKHDGSFLRRDFVIRIQQCCFNQPSKSTSADHTTSVVASAVKYENIMKSAQKTERSVAVERKVGINVRTKRGSKESTCTRIVESKCIETIEQCLKKRRLIDSSAIVTRRKAASNINYEFFSLSNNKKESVISETKGGKFSKNQRNQLIQSEEQCINSQKEMNNSSIKLNPKERKQRKNVDPKINIGEPQPSCSHSFSSSNNITEQISKNSKLFEMKSSKSNDSKVLTKVKPNSKQKAESIQYHITQKSGLTNHDSKKKLNLTVKEKHHEKHDIEHAEISYINCFLEEIPADRRITRQSKNSSVLKNNFPLEDHNNTFERNENEQYSKNTVKQLNTKCVQKSKENLNEKPKCTDKPAKKHMSKTEAKRKTEKFNEQKKILKNANRDTRPTKISELEITTSRRITRFSSKAQSDNSFVNDSRSEIARATPCVTFSTRTPEVIPRFNKRNKVDASVLTPRIVLDKLDASDISTYAITPLREDRKPLPPKSSENYGIDDVNTDDSTDEEDNPKKVVPDWVKFVGHQSEVQFCFPRDTIRNWIRPPSTRFTVKSLFF